MKMQTLEILSQNRIPITERGTLKRKYFEIPASSVSPEKLRSLGFRLGQGTGQITYLVYYRGEFCGIVHE